LVACDSWTNWLNFGRYSKRKILNISKVIPKMSTEQC
jgi:hypothetical protein